MKIDPNISLEDFKAEMQHRVVRYSPRSLAVKHALRFARKHQDPEFYRVATNKVLAQKQFAREMYGPGLFERLFDYLSLGSLREVVVTVMLVGLGILGIDVGKRAIQQFSPPPSRLEGMEVEQLAKQLGIELEPTPVVNGAKGAQDPKSPAGKEGQAAKTQRPPNVANLSDADVQRIAAAVLAAMRQPESVPEPTETTPTAAQVDASPAGALVAAESASGPALPASATGTPTAPSPIE
ncbi:MAG: hypothetical protein U0892_04330 [Pirellulales bacterium]